MSLLADLDISLTAVFIAGMEFLALDVEGLRELRAHDPFSIGEVIRAEPLEIAHSQLRRKLLVKNRNGLQFVILTEHSSL